MKLFDKLFKKKETPENSKAHYHGNLKRGSYALIITAIVLAAIILVNYIVSAVSKKVNLEYDMSGNYTHTISKENEKFIKSVDSKVQIIVCADKKDYKDNLLAYAQQTYTTTGDQRYFQQTVYLLDKYADLNNNIELIYMDTKSTEYAAISQQYSNLKLSFGDIIVRAEKTDKSGNSKYKHLAFNDVYSTTDPSGYAAYGYDYYAVSGNNVETAVSGAISYVLSEKTYKVGIITGHSNSDYSAAYTKLLSDNNYEVQKNTDSFVGKISNDFDAIAIMTPTIDFISSEIDAISSFLDNDGNGGKGLIYFADASTPALPNFYELLNEWGICVDEGILLETNKDYIPNESERSALYVLPNGSDLTENMNGFIAGYNVPMSKGEAADDNITVTEVAKTLSTVVAAPVGAGDDYSDYSEGDLKSYAGIIESNKEFDYSSSYIIAFGSIEYIDSDWAENSNIANKDVVLSATERVSGSNVNGFGFVEKSITEDSFANELSASDSERVRNIFMILLPIAVLAFGIYVFFKRRNSR